MRASRRAAVWWKRSDDGITTLQVLVMFPVIVFLLGISMQVALDYYAKQVALGAAQAGVTAIRYAQLGPNDEAKAEALADAAAQDYVAKHGGNLLVAPAVTKTSPVLQAPSTGTPGWQINVGVTGTPINLVPVLDGAVSQVAGAPLENFTWGLK